MNFMLSIIKFIKFKPIIKFKKFESHNYGFYCDKFGDIQLCVATCRLFVQQVWRR